MEHASFLNQFFMWFGPYKFPMLLLALIVVVLIIVKAVDLLFMRSLSESRKKRWLNSILFWGAIGLVFGMFAQTASLWVALQEIMHAKDLSPPIIIMGFLGSFAPTLFGLLILLVAAIAWWLLRVVYRRSLINVPEN